MDDLPLVNVFKCHADLNEPVEDLHLSEALLFLNLSLDVVGQITDYQITKLVQINLLTFAIIHDNRQRVVPKETFLIANNVWMFQTLENASFHHAAGLLAVAHSLKNDFLSNILLVLALVGDDPGGAKVATTNTVLLFVRRSVSLGHLASYTNTIFI